MGDGGAGIRAGAGADAFARRDAAAGFAAHLVRVPVDPNGLLAPAFLGLPVGPHAEERRVPKPPLLGPLREADLAYQPRLHPVMTGPARAAFRERRRLARERLEHLRDALERGCVEPRAGLRDVHEPRALIQAHVERAELGAGALRLGVAADHEFLTAVALDLDPVRRAAARVAALKALRDDPLEPHLGRRGEKLLAVLQNMVRALHGRERRHDAGEKLLPIHQREAAQVVGLEPEAVEEDAADRHLDHRRLDIAGAREVHPGLEPLEAGTAGLILGDDLAVEHEARHGERAQPVRDLGIALRDLLAAPPDEPDLVVLARSQHPHSVVLDLEAPIRPRGWTLGERGQRERNLPREKLPLRRADRAHAFPQGRESAGHVAHLLDRQARDHGLGIALNRFLLGRGGVRLLEEQPLLLLLPHANERPATAQLEPEQLQLQLPALVLLERILRLERPEPAAIPHDDRAGSVVSGRDHSLEVPVLERMVLDVNCQALLLDAG